MSGAQVPTIYPVSPPGRSIQRRIPSKECALSQRTVHTLLNMGINDLDMLKRLTGFARLHTLNRVNGLQPHNRPPQNRTRLIHPRRSRRRDKKLTPFVPSAAFTMLAVYDLS